MATITFKGNPIQTCGELPAVDAQAPHFTLTRGDLSEFSSCDYHNQIFVLNIFPSLDTSVCAASVHQFNEMASKLNNVLILAISMDLPFAQSRFCSTNGIDRVVALSAFRSPEFANDYGVKITTGPMHGLLARAVVIINGQGKVIYSEMVSEITHEPNYDAVMSVLKG